MKAPTFAVELANRKVQQVEAVKARARTLLVEVELIKGVFQDESINRDLLSSMDTNMVHINDALVAWVRAALATP